MSDNESVTASSANPGWNSFARAHASQKWRKQSAAMGASLTQAIVEAARVEPGMQVLDIACGTGEPAISLAALRVIGGVIGIDISPEPLKIAAERAAERGLTNAQFQQADAHKLPFPDESFHRITSRLGVMFFAEPLQALREMQRVLKPGGTATLMVWGPISQPYFETTIGTVLKLMPGSAVPAEGLKMFSFAEAGTLASALRQAKFSRAEERFVTLPFPWPGSPEELWEYFQSVAVPFASMLQSIHAPHRTAVDETVLREIGRYYDGETVKFTATVNITVAVK
ncbi:MAG TPA: methyltransferase domain-containing protein [Candidatus Angelobacter sp.]|nr:methyltransferase domain-containing protein [Candidatus Angelobacter sp.]